MTHPIKIGFVITHNYGSSPGSILRVMELCNNLVNFNVNVIVYSFFKKDNGWDPRVKYIQLNVGFLKNDKTLLFLYGLIRRIFQSKVMMKLFPIQKFLISYQISNLHKILSNSIDKEVDYIQAEQEIACLACLRYKEHSKIKLISSLHNIWSDELVASKIIRPEDRMYKFISHLEKRILKESDKIIVVSNLMKSYIINKHSLNVTDNIFVIKPGVTKRIEDKTSRVSDKSLKDYKVVYSGLVNYRSNVELYIYSMPFILKKFPKVKFYITDRGKNIKKIKSIAKSIGVNPCFYWFEEKDEFYNFLASCDIGIVTSSNDIPRKIGPAVKLWDYISVCLPVIGNDIGGWTNIIEKEKIGILTTNDPEDFASAIIKLLDDNKLYEEFRENCLKYSEKANSWTDSAKKLVKIYNCLE
jgi:glycosyltransferase involved in cell wall biosynthesis